MTATTAATNATFLAHTAHVDRDKTDSRCPICADQGATRLTWKAFTAKYPFWNTTPEVAAAIQAMTPKGREAMTAIGLGQVSFFDAGIVEHSGSWGEVLTGDLGHKSSGVLNRLRDLGLWEVTPQTDDEYKAGAWWDLTALGAAVAQHLAATSKTTTTTTTENTTTKESTMTENTTAKKSAAKAPAKKAAATKEITTEGRAYSVPKGYEVKWQHGGHDLLRKTDADVNGPAWFTACNAHGDLHEAANAKEAEGFGVLKVRSTWCKGDHKPAAKKAAPAKGAQASATADAKTAAAKAPAKASTTTKAAKAAASK